MRAVAASSLVVACAAVSTGAGPAANAALTPGDWPTYHLDNLRDGYQSRLNPLSTLSLDWNATLDGAVYGQPLVVHGMIFAATENDTVYALNRSTGAVVWSTHLGSPEPLANLPCGDIDPLGITSTMVFDPDTNRIFALAELLGGTHKLVGINAGTGAVEVQVSADPPLGDAIAHQQRGALTLLNGRVYIPYGGLFGDCGNYIGQVISFTTAGSGLQSYAIPTTREAGIWGTGGAVVDNGNLLYASGNGAAESGTYDGSDSVIELSPSLQRLDFFAPTDWAGQNSGDADLGSMTPALVGGQFIYEDGKTNTGYVLKNGALGGVGGQIAELTNTCQTFGTAAIVGNTVYLPCTTGPQAVTIGSTGTPQQLWKSIVPAEGSPVVGGGAVWAMDYFGGELYALDPATGATKAQIQIGRAPTFASPTLMGDQVFVGTLSGVVAVGGA